MGMFDYLNFKMPLPDGAPKNPYQTKSLKCEMDTYEIREDGTLWGEQYDSEGWTKHNVTPRKCDHYTGEVRFYGMTGSDPDLWWEFVALIAQGKLVHLETIQTPGDEP